MRHVDLLKIATALNLARLAGRTFRKPIVQLRGPAGNFRVRHDGYYQWPGKGPQAAFTALQDIPGVSVNRSSFMQPALERAGFGRPRIIPYEMWKALQQPNMFK